MRLFPSSSILKKKGRIIFFWEENSFWRNNLVIWQVNFSHIQVVSFSIKTRNKPRQKKSGRTLYLLGIVVTNTIWTIQWISKMLKTCIKTIIYVRILRPPDPLLVKKYLRHKNDDSKSLKKNCFCHKHHCCICHLFLQDRIIK